MSGVRPGSLFWTAAMQENQDARDLEEFRCQQAAKDAAPMIADGSWLPGKWIDRGIISIGECAPNDLEMHSKVTCDDCKWYWHCSLATNKFIISGKSKPLHGIRYKCVACPNFDLCSKCLLTTNHDKKHQFQAITKSQFIYQTVGETAAATKPTETPADNTAGTDTKVGSPKVSDTETLAFWMVRSRLDVVKKESAAMSELLLTSCKDIVKPSQFKGAMEPVEGLIKLFAS